MQNPSGDAYDVTYPTRDESGRLLVPTGYWRPVTRPPARWIVLELQTGATIITTRRRWLARLAAWWYGRGFAAERLIEWYDVSDQIVWGTTPNTEV